MFDRNCECCSLQFFFQNLIILFSVLARAAPCQDGPHRIRSSYSKKFCWSTVDLASGYCIFGEFWYCTGLIAPFSLQYYSKRLARKSANDVDL